MDQQLPKNEEFMFFIQPTKTRKEMANEYGMGLKAFARRLHFYNIELPPGLITPKHQLLIYSALGTPPIKPDK